MKVETRFSCGDEIWTIYSEQTYRKVDCLTCERSGEVTIGAEKFICPKCHGQSKHDKYVGNLWHIGYNSRVGQVTYEHRVGTGYEDGVKIEYMIVATGVGSGTLYKEDNVFASREEAQSVCDARNAAILTPTP